MTQACADWVQENGLKDYGGATLREFCRHFGIDDMTYYNWMKRSAFSEAIEKAKTSFRDNREKDIVESLVNMAKGYDHEQCTTEYTNVNGKLEMKKQTKKTVHVEPNVAAAIFLLTNLAPERWKNRQDNKADIKADGTFVTINHEYTGFEPASSEEEVKGRGMSNKYTMEEQMQVNGELYDANNDPKYRIFVNQGGTSSGKTYCIMQLLVVRSMERPKQVITVVGEDLPNLKVGALRDMQTIISGSEDLRRWFTENKTDHYFTGANGSIIEFKSYDSPQDAKSGKRDYLFVNEANGISYEIYWQLAMRTRKGVYLDYNPSARFWVHDKLIGRAEVKTIITDHRGNWFLSDEEHAKIEGIDDYELWQVYARGLTGKITGLVFPDFRIVDAMPPLDECKMRAYGLDFGYVNDESALEEVRLAHGELWTDEIIYETGLTNPELSRKFKDNGINRRALIIADCAEMKSVAELANMGWNVVPSVKGADSINASIDILHRYKWNVTRRSAGLIDNLKKYKWLVNRDGERLNKPIDKFNHGIDAVRYVALRQLKVHRAGAAKAVLTEL